MCCSDSNLSESEVDEDEVNVVDALFIDVDEFNEENLLVDEGFLGFDNEDVDKHVDK